MRRSSPPHTGAWLMASSAGASTTATASLLCSVSFNDIISRVDIPNQESTSPRLTSWATAGGRLTCLPLCLGCLCLSSSCSLSGNNRAFWIISKKIFLIQRSEAGHGQGDSRVWGEQAEGRLQEVDHGISQEASGHILLTHDDDSSACR